MKNAARKTIEWEPQTESPSPLKAMKTTTMESTQTNLKTEAVTAAVLEFLDEWYDQLERVTGLARKGLLKELQLCESLSYDQTPLHEAQKRRVNKAFEALLFLNELLLLCHNVEINKTVYSGTELKEAQESERSSILKLLFEESTETHLTMITVQRLTLLGVQRSYTEDGNAPNQADDDALYFCENILEYLHKHTLL